MREGNERENERRKREREKRENERGSLLICMHRAIIDPSQ
jgi:hypothetical protein